MLNYLILATSCLFTNETEFVDESFANLITLLKKFNGSSQLKPLLISVVKAFSRNGHFKGLEEKYTLEYFKVDRSFSRIFLTRDNIKQVIRNILTNRIVLKSIQKETRFVFRSKTNESVYSALHNNKKVFFHKLRTPRCTFSVYPNKEKSFYVLFTEGKSGSFEHFERSVKTALEYPAKLTSFKELVSFNLEHASVLSFYENHFIDPTNSRLTQKSNFLLSKKLTTSFSEKGLLIEQILDYPVRTDEVKNSPVFFLFRHDRVSNSLEFVLGTGKFQTQFLLDCSVLPKVDGTVLEKESYSLKPCEKTNKTICWQIIQKDPNIEILLILSATRKENSFFLKIANAVFKLESRKLFKTRSKHLQHLLLQKNRCSFVVESRTNPLSSSRIKRKNSLSVTEEKEEPVRSPSTISIEEKEEEHTEKQPEKDSYVSKLPNYIEKEDSGVVKTNPDKEKPSLKLKARQNAFPEIQKDRNSKEKNNTNVQNQKLPPDNFKFKQCYPNKFCLEMVVPEVCFIEVMHDLSVVFKYRKKDVFEYAQKTSILFLKSCFERFPRAVLKLNCEEELVVIKKDFLVLETVRLLIEWLKGQEKKAEASTQQVFDWKSELALEYFHVLYYPYGVFFPVVANSLVSKHGERKMDQPFTEPSFFRVSLDKMPKAFLLPTCTLFLRERLFLFAEEVSAVWEFSFSYDNKDFDFSSRVIWDNPLKGKQTFSSLDCSYSGKFELSLETNGFAFNFFRTESVTEPKKDSVFLTDFKENLLLCKDSEFFYKQTNFVLCREKLGLVSAQLLEWAKTFSPTSQFVDFLKAFNKNEGNETELKTAVTHTTRETLALEVGGHVNTYFLVKCRGKFLRDELFVVYSVPLTKQVLLFYYLVSDASRFKQVAGSLNEYVQKKLTTVEETELEFFVPAAELEGVKQQLLFGTRYATDFELSLNFKQLFLTSKTFRDGSEAQNQLLFDSFFFDKSVYFVLYDVDKKTTIAEVWKMNYATPTTTVFAKVRKWLSTTKQTTWFMNSWLVKAEAFVFVHAFVLLIIKVHSWLVKLREQRKQRLDNSEANFVLAAHGLDATKNKCLY